MVELEIRNKYKKAINSSISLLFINLIMELTVYWITQNESNIMSFSLLVLCLVYMFIYSFEILSIITDKYFFDIFLKYYIKDIKNIIKIFK